MTETKELLITMRDGGRLLVKDVPADAKVTFSTVNPASNRDWGGYCLRIYKTENQQLAVFTQVESFRDLSLRVFERKEQLTEEAHVAAGPNGRRERHDAQVAAEWEEVRL